MGQKLFVVRVGKLVKIKFPRASARLVTGGIQVFNFRLTHNLPFHNLRLQHPPGVIKGRTTTTATTRPENSVCTLGKAG